MSKIRLLMCAESGNINSGFGLYTREILKRLYDSNLFEIAELSCYASVENKPNVPWKVYPNAISNPNDPRYKTYLSNSINAFGLWRFDQVVVDFKPDIVFDMRDYWMMSYQEISITRPYFNWVIAPTIDSLPQKNSWLRTYANADLVLAHTDWAIEYLDKCNMGINVGKAVSDSVDTSVYSPISYSKNFQKQKLNIPQDSFIIGSVMRNQKRKLIPNLFGCLKSLIQYTNNHNIFLYLHTSYPENSGWDIPEYLQEYNIYNNVLFTYYCLSCKEVHASLYQGPKKRCLYCKNETCIMPNVNRGITDEQMSSIYNAFDFYVQYAICEGLGIPQLEAAACGVPICSVDYSAMSEVTTKLDAYKVSYALSRELETSALRAVPNDSHLVQIIYDFMKLTDEQKKQKSIDIRNKILENYSWDKTASVLIEQLLSLKPKKIWHQKLTTNHELKVPKELSNREFVKFLINHVIKSPHLLTSNFIQEMVRDLDLGVHKTQSGQTKFTRENVVKILEQILNHKIRIKDIQSGKLDQSQEDFISAANNAIK